MTLLLAGLLVGAWGCGDDGGGTTPDTDASDTREEDALEDDPADDTDAQDDADAAEDTEEEVSPDPAPPWVAFSWDAPLTEPGHFFDFPWPSDVRRDADGRPQMQGMELGSRGGLPGRLGPALIENVAALGDFPRLSVAWFRFGEPLAERVETDVISSSVEAPFWLVDIDPDSPRRGTLYPLVAATLDTDRYTDPNVVGLSPLPGVVLRPNTTYAYVIWQRAMGADGEPIPVGGNWAALLAGDAPAALNALYAPLWEVVQDLGEDRASMAAATVFTTGDEVARLAEISDALLLAHTVEVEGLAIDPADGADHERYCELHGWIDMPQFQEGTPPFDTLGRFVEDGDGIPVFQRIERVPVVVNLPKEEMPEEGFPLVIYIHGSGGLSTQVVDRSPRATASDPVVPGFGPAHVLAGHGLGSASAAMPVNPERLPGAGETAYLNLNNLAAFRDTFRQGVIEQRLFASALHALEISPEVVAACDGLALPDGADAYTFRVEPLLVMGQSMGGMYTNMFGAVDARVAAVVPTGAGGYWSYFILRTNLIPGVANLLSVALNTRARLTWMHPFLHLLQSAWEGAEPMGYVGRLSMMPLEGHPARPVYQVAGEGDSYFPTVVYDAMAVAYQNRQVGDEVWSTMQPWLQEVGLAGFETYPVRNNLVSESGEPYTGAIVQYAGDGFSDPHDIFVQLEEVRHQYGCFFRTFLDDGEATIVAPAPVGSPCAVEAAD